ncbi:hypothetical protein COBT_002866 [Conglomerata obtusa]
MFEIFTQYNFSTKTEDCKIEESTENPLFDLTFAAVNNTNYKHLKADLIILVSKYLTWCSQIFEFDNDYIFSFSMYKSEILKIISYLNEERSSDEMSKNDNETGSFKDKKELNFIQHESFGNTKTVACILFQKTIEAKDLDDLFSEAEYTFEISSFENCCANLQDIHQIINPFDQLQAYTPPEYIEKKLVCYKSDIWRLGILALELKSKSYSESFIDEDTSDAAYKYIEWLLIRLRELNRVDDFYDFIHKCLNKDPDLRPTASELLEHPFLTKKPILKV